MAHLDEDKSWNEANDKDIYKKIIKRIDHLTDSEMVDHPKHYNMGKIEVIDVIEDWKLGFNDGNAVKYIGRAQYKGNEIQDIEKAIWYLNRHLTYLKKAEHEKS